VADIFSCRGKGQFNFSRADQLLGTLDRGATAIEVCAGTMSYVTDMQWGCGQTNA
jgi:hypothetical protein